MKSNILMVSALFVAAAIAPLHAMQTDNQSDPTNYDQVAVMKKLLFLDMDNGPVGQKFGQGTFALKTGSGLAQFNTVFSSPVATEEDVAQVEIFMEGTAHSWWVGPGQDDLKQILEHNGYTFSHSEYQMIADFHETEASTVNNGSSPSRVPKSTVMSIIDRNDNSKTSEITIKIAVNEEDFEVWANTAAQGFELPRGEFDTFLDYVFKKANLYSHRFYIAYVQDVPVSTAMVMYHWGDTPVVHLVSTLEEHRNKGYATAVMKKLLLDFYLDSAWPVFLLATKETREWFKKLKPHRLFPFADVMTHNVYVKGGLEHHAQASGRSGCHLF